VDVALKLFPDHFLMIQIAFPDFNMKRKCLQDQAPWLLPHGILATFRFLVRSASLLACRFLRILTCHQFGRGIEETLETNHVYGNAVLRQLGASR